MLAEICSYLDKIRVYYERNVDIKKYSAIRIGGVGTLIVFPQSAEDLILVIDFFEKNTVSYKIIGRMTNLLPCDGTCETVLISTAKIKEFVLKEKRVILGCGAVLSRMLQKLGDRGLGGAEALIHIPGSVGGMIYSNAGAFGSEISDFFLRAELYNPITKSVQVFLKSDMNFGYRESVLKNSKLILLRAELMLFECDREEFLKKTRYYRELRKKSQPVEYPSLGSVFKKSNGISAGELIDKCGLRGARIGGAVISEKHAGFIVNNTSATSEDVRALVRLAQDTVFSKFGIRLEREIEYL